MRRQVAHPAGVAGRRHPLLARRRQVPGGNRVAILGRLALGRRRGRRLRYRGHGHLRRGLAALLGRRPALLESGRDDLFRLAALVRDRRHRRGRLRRTHVPAGHRRPGGPARRHHLIDRQGQGRQQQHPGRRQHPAHPGRGPCQRFSVASRGRVGVAHHLGLSIGDCFPAVYQAVHALAALGGYHRRLTEQQGEDLVTRGNFGKMNIRFVRQLLQLHHLLGVQLVFEVLGHVVGVDSARAGGRRYGQAAAVRHLLDAGDQFLGGVTLGHLLAKLLDLRRRQGVVEVGQQGPQGQSAHRCSPHRAWAFTGNSGPPRRFSCNIRPRISLLPRSRPRRYQPSPS